MASLTHLKLQYTFRVIGYNKQLLESRGQGHGSGEKICKCPTKKFECILQPRTYTMYITKYIDNTFINLEFRPLQSIVFGFHSPLNAHRTIVSNTPLNNNNNYNILLLLQLLFWPYFELLVRLARVNNNITTFVFMDIHYTRNE